MNKILLLAGVCCLMPLDLKAAEFTPYVSAKMAAIWNRNTVHMDDYLDPAIVPFAGNALETTKTKVNRWRFGTSMAIGLKTKLCNNDGLRAEVEYNYRKPSVRSTHLAETVNVGLFDVNSLEATKTKISSDSVMMNIYYDFNTGTRFIPYLGAGLGVTKLKATFKSFDTDDFSAEYNGSGLSRSKNNLSWNVSAGVGYMLTNNLTFDAGYRYVDNGSISMYYQDYSGKVSVDSKSHEFMLGLRYEF